MQEGKKMEAWEYIIAETILEHSREKRAAKQRTQQQAQQRAQEARRRQREQADKAIEDLKRWCGIDW